VAINSQCAFDVLQNASIIGYSKCLLFQQSGVADKLDAGRGILKTRYYRQHCTIDYGSYTKDLSNISNDLSSIFILDNSPGAYRSYPGSFFLITNYGLIEYEVISLNKLTIYFTFTANAMPIKSWFSDPSDTALLNLLPVLDALRFTQDVRSVLSRNLQVHRPY